MNSIASSFRCRVLRHPLKSIVLRKKSLYLWSHKSNSMVSIRFASTDAKSGLLSKLRNIFKPSSDERTSMRPRVRSVMDLAPRNSQPPIGEPDMPEKCDRKVDKKEEKDKKSGLKTETDDEPSYKYQWGVRVPDANTEPPELEKSRNYVVTHKWGVNMHNYTKPEVPPITDNALTSPSAKTNVLTTFEESNMEVRTAKPFTQVNQSQSLNLPKARSTLEEARSKIIANTKIEKSSSEDNHVEIENASSRASNLETSQTLTSVAPTNEQEFLSKKPQSVATSGVDLTSGSIVQGDDDYNVPPEIPHDNELFAWRDVVIRSKLHEEELAHMAAMELSNDSNRSIFIRPEPPQPKLDVQVVGSVNDVVGSTEQNVEKSVSVGLTTKAMNLTIKKFHTYGIACCTSPSFYSKSMLVKSLTTTSTDRKDESPLPPDSEDSSRIEADETKQIQAQQEIREAPKVKEDLSNVLNDLSKRDMEVLLSYTQHNSEEAGICPTLPTSVTISTIPSSTNKNTSEYVQQNESGNEIFNAEDSIANPTMTELERTILKLKTGDDKEEGKEIKDKKGIKDEDYIRIPGDPYPYSREHYEKWRVPHGKCPIVNDDVPKVKPAETNDSPR